MTKKYNYGMVCSLLCLLVICVFWTLDDYFDFPLKESEYIIVSNIWLAAFAICGTVNESIKKGYPK